MEAILVHPDVIAPITRMMRPIARLFAMPQTI
jgi:hypothetical protein